MLAEDAEGKPLFTRFPYGKGMVYYLNYPLEINTLGVSDAYEGNQHEVYKMVFAEVLEKHVVSCDNKYVGITMHIDRNKVYAVMINYSGEKVWTNIKVNDQYRITRVVKGEVESIEPFESVILELELKS